MSAYVSRQNIIYPHIFIFPLSIDVYVSLCLCPVRNKRTTIRHTSHADLIIHASISRMGVTMRDKVYVVFLFFYLHWFVIYFRCTFVVFNDCGHQFASLNKKCLFLSLIDMQLWFWDFQEPNRTTRQPKLKQSVNRGKSNIFSISVIWHFRYIKTHFYCFIVIHAISYREII